MAMARGGVAVIVGTLTTGGIRQWCWRVNVQNVFANFEISDALMQRLSA
jgi:hypothetical protein